MLGQTRPTRQLTVLTLLGLSTVLVPFALASHAATTASGVISGVGTNYSLDLRNTGTDPIRCMTLDVAPGVTTTTASGPSGAVGGVLSGGGRFGFQQLDIAPSAAATFSFTTLAPYPASAGGDLQVSSDCQTYVLVRATGPTSPCNCQRVGTTVARKTLDFTSLRRYRFQLVWTMNCAGDAGNCEGDVNFIPPRGFTMTTPRNSTISCTGTCASTSSGVIEVAGTFPRDMRTPDQRRNKTVILAFKTFCTQNGVRIAAANGAITAVYNANGRLDERKSDLNGDGLPDARKRK